MIQVGFIGPNVGPRYKAEIENWRMSRTFSHKGLKDLFSTNCMRTVCCMRAMSGLSGMENTELDYRV